MIERRRLLGDLHRVASLFAMIAGEEFRARAWENAARAVEQMTELELTRRVGRETLREVPGIGPAIATAIAGWARTQTLPDLEALRSRFPAGVEELLDVPGLGPKRVVTLVRDLGVHTLAELEVACADHRVARVKGFGQKTQAKILGAIVAFRRYRQSVLLSDATVVAMRLVDALPQADGRLWMVGSVARGCETVHDIDLAYCGDLDADDLGRRLGLSRVETRSDGVSRYQGAGIPVDVHPVPRERAGTLRVMLTATADVQALLDAAAREAGVDLATVGFATPADLFCALELPEIPPELLEDEGGLRAVQAGALLDLLRAGDIRGNLHTHTTWSDGRQTIREMVAAAEYLGHHFLAITDHSASAHYAGGLPAEALFRQREEIEEVQGEHPELTLFQGVESDVLPDGRLDYDDEVLDTLDFAIASIHTRFDLDQATMTARVLRALADPRVAIFAHPTGRLLLQREPYEIDLEAVLQACRQYRVAIELNANPQRLDLDWRWLRRAAELGVVVALNTDAHEASGLGDLVWGVTVARRAALPRDLVMNTWEAGRVRAFLGKRL